MLVAAMLTCFVLLEEGAVVLPAPELPAKEVGPEEEEEDEEDEEEDLARYSLTSPSTFSMLCSFAIKRSISAAFEFAFVKGRLLCVYI